MVKPRKVVGGGGAGSRSYVAKARLCAGHDDQGIPIGKKRRVGGNCSGDELPDEGAAVMQADQQILLIFKFPVVVV
jgi:hypothetical protein